MIPLKCSVFSVMQSTFRLSNVEILAVPTTSLIYNFCHLGTSDRILVGKKGLDATSALENHPEDPGKRGHIVADTLLPMMFLGLRKLGNICYGPKMFLNKIRNIFCPGHKICVRNKCCARGQMGKHLCPQQCVRNNVSSFARAFRSMQP